MSKKTRKLKPHAHTPKCECGGDFCNGRMVFNGVRFVCEEGQSTLSDHSSRWPVYVAAPELLEACKAADVAFMGLRHSCNAQEWRDSFVHEELAWKKVRRAIAKAELKRERITDASP